MKSVYIKIISITAALFMCTSVIAVSSESPTVDNLPVQIGVAENTNSSAVAEYEVVAENSKITMFADLKRGWFAIRNNSNGYFWYSHPNDTLMDKTTVGVNKQNFQSDIIVSYLSKDDVGDTSSYTEASISSNAGALKNETVYVEKIKNGIRVTYDFYTISTRIPVEYKISDGNLIARIDAKGILERKEFRKAIKNEISSEESQLLQDSYITSIWLLPCFGAGTEGNEGFVFVPDGCGAFINYTPSKEITEIFTKQIYGKDLSIDEYGVKSEEFASVSTDVNICMPVFGGVKDNNGYFAIITKGAEIASIKAFKAGKSSKYTGVSSQVDYRYATFSTIGGRKVQKITDVFKELPDYEVTYKLLNEENSSYLGFAKIYREHLIKENKLSKKDYNSSIALKTIGAVDVDGTFLGFSCKRIKPLTTIGGLDSIIEDIKSELDYSVAVNYIGWNNNGVQNRKMLKSAKPIKTLGSQKELNQLVTKITENKDEIYLDSDFVTFSKSGNGVSKNSDSAQTVFGKSALRRKFLYSTFTYESKGLYLLSPSKLTSVFNKYYKSFGKINRNAGISLNSIGQYSYSDFNVDNKVSRIDTIKYYLEILDSIGNRNQSAECANDYMWKYVERIYSAPVSSSRQLIYDGEVPFYQLVLHGYVALTSSPINQANDRYNAFLRAVETGSELMFICTDEDVSIVNGTQHDYLYSATYKLWKNDLKEFQTKYSKLLEKVSDKEIIGYEQIQPSVSKTIYENGTVVYVNYLDKDIILENGISIKAKDFRVEEDV